MSVFQLCLDCLRLILDYLHHHSVTLLSKNWSDFFSEVNIIDHLKLCGGRDAFYCVLSLVLICLEEKRLFTEDLPNTEDLYLLVYYLISAS